MFCIKSSFEIGRSEDRGVRVKATMPCQPPLCVTQSMEEYVLGADCSSTDLAATLFYSLKYSHFKGAGSLWVCPSLEYLGIFYCV